VEGVQILLIGLESNNTQTELSSRTKKVDKAQTAPTPEDISFPAQISASKVNF